MGSNEDVYDDVIFLSLTVSLYSTVDVTRSQQNAAHLPKRASTATEPTYLSLKSSSTWIAFLGRSTESTTQWSTGTRGSTSPAHVFPTTTINSSRSAIYTRSHFFWRRRRRKLLRRRTISRSSEAYVSSNPRAWQYTVPSLVPGDRRSYYRGHGRRIRTRRAQRLGGHGSGLVLFLGGDLGVLPPRAVLSRSKQARHQVVAIDH